MLMGNYILFVSIHTMNNKHIFNDREIHCSYVQPEGQQVRRSSQHTDPIPYSQHLYPPVTYGQHLSTLRQRVPSGQISDGDGGPMK